MSTEFTDNLARRLRDLRRSVQMTQDDVAEILGMSRTSFSKYENGAARPSLAVLRKLAKLYNISIEELIYEDNAKIVFKSSDTKFEPDPDIISNYFSVLTPEERKIILKLRMMDKDTLASVSDNIDVNFRKCVVWEDEEEE